MSRTDAASAGIAVAIAALVAGGLEFSAGYYALASGILGGIAVIAAGAAVLLGLMPTRAAVGVACSLLGLAAWAGLSTVWGGLPQPAWRFAGTLVAAAAAVIAGSSLAARGRAVGVGVLIGITVHAVLVITIVAAGAEPENWFRIRQLEGPIGYHNGEAVVAAMGVPLAVWIGTFARSWARAAGASAAVFLLGLAFLTQSRGSLAAVALALTIQVVTARRARVALLVVMLVPVSAALFLSLRNVDRALVDGRPLDDPAFAHYGLVTLVLALVVGGLSLIPLPPHRLGRRHVVAIVSTVAVVALVTAAIAAAIVAPRFDSLRSRLTAEPNWPTKVAAGDTRLSSLSPTGRIELWRVASDMIAERPFHGYGLGTFTLRWTVDRTNKDAYVLQPHSIELEMFAELGVVGFAWLLAFGGGVAWCIARGLGRDRALAAAVAGAVAAFFFISSVDWVFGFTGLIVPAMLLTGAAAGHGRTSVPSRPAAVAVVASVLLALGILAGPAIAQRNLDRARTQAATSLLKATSTAAAARSWDRWDPSVIAFQASLAEQQGRLLVAAAEFHKAATLSRQPWSLYFSEADVLHRAGRIAASEAACRRAIAANPLEPDLRREPCDTVR